MLSIVSRISVLACAWALGFILFSSDVSGQKSASEAERKIAALVRAVDGAEAAVAFSDLQTGAELMINADANFHAASTMKVPVMVEIFRQVQESKLSLDEKITVRNEFKSIVDESAYKLTAEDDSEQSLYGLVGKEVPLRDLMRLMITESSNLATNILIERVTPARVMQLMSTLGARDIRVRRGVEDEKAYERGLNNTTTARDLMIVLRHIAGRRAVSARASDEMLRILSEQKFKEGIPAGLPATARVAHKTGSITKIRHDAAIVFLPHREKPYVLVVLTRGITDGKRADQLIASISRMIYDNLKQ